MVTHVPLGNISKFVRGVTYKPADLIDNFSENSIVCMRTANIQAELDENDLKSIKSSVVKSIDKYLIEGDILVSTANSWNLVGKCCWVKKLNYPAVPGGFIAALRVDKSKADPRYVYHWFNSKNTQELARNCGRQTTNISNMDLNRCLSLELPLPSLAEQRRIAAILDKAEALRAKRREAIAKLDLLLQSVFLEMFGDPSSTSAKWPNLALEDIASSRLGKMLDKKTSQGDSMKKYLANLNVQWGYFRLDDLREMNFDANEQEEFSLEKGDILMCEGGEPGRCAIWDNQINDCYFQKALHRIRCNKEKCTPEYLSYLFFILSKKDFFKSSVTTATIAHLPGIKLKKLKIPVPPLNNQEKFSQIYRFISLKKEKMKESFFLNENLNISLQHKYFS